MALTNQTYKRSLAGSIGAGINSVLSGAGRTYYILEHKVSSKFHKAGESQEIIVDQIELGRDPKCQVQFDESFSTVSRRHAAIVREGDNWKLIQLSKTNTTYLNGRPIQTEWYLQNGDEIQLSTNGPKLGFIVPTGNKAKTGSIALSRRLSLFRQQALKPYKTAMSVMAVLLVLLMVGGGYLAWDNHIKGGEINRLTGEIEQTNATATQLVTDMRIADSIRVAEEQKHQEEIAKLKKENAKIKNDLKDLVASQGASAGSVDVSGSGNSDLKSSEVDVYYIQMSNLTVEYEGEKKVINEGVFGSGTGFLLNDGRFVTARHVVEPWMYCKPEEENLVFANMILHQGAKVTMTLDAYSPTGKHLSFVNTQAKVDRSYDERVDFDNGLYIMLGAHHKDFAYFRTNERGALAYHSQLSNQLEARTKLVILGYPLSLGVNNSNDIHPLYSEATVAKDGLDNGVILTTATTFEHGNSGGPVFVKTTKGELIVVGIVSAGAGRSTGFVIPISAMY